MSGATKWIPSGLGYAGPPPLTNEKKLAYAAENKTDGVIIEELLRLAGLTNIDSPLPEMGLILGTLQPVALPVGQAPQSLIKRIDDLTWYDTIERSDGLITRIPRTILPSASATRTFTEGVDIYNLKRGRTTEGAYANVIVTGISGVGNDGISAYTVEYESDNPIPDANGLDDTYTYNDDLIETEEIASAWGMTFLGEFGQVLQTFECELLTGDSTLHAGMTISIVSAKFALTSDSRFLIQSVRHVSQNAGPFVTYLTIKGSANPTGTDANQGPFVNIKVLYDLEYLGGVKSIIAIFDARESYDPDGEEGAFNNGIVTWEWDGDPVVPIPSSNGQMAVAIYSPSSLIYGATVSLRLGDNHGKHTTKTLTLNPSTTKDLMIRDLWAATPDSGVIFSNNGAKFWQDMGVPNGKGVCEVAGKEYNLAWDGSGELWRILAEMNSAVAVKVITGQNVSAASITINGDGEETGVCWAGTVGGDVWKSTSQGLLTTWVKVTTPSTKLPAEITSISESPFASGSLQATASHGFYISFDGGTTWIKIFEHPNAGSRATHFVGGFIPLTPTEAESKGFVSFDGARTSGQDHFVMERTDDLHPSAFAFPAADLEVQIEAMTLEVDGSYLYAVGWDHLGHGGAWEIKPDADGEFLRKFWNNTRSGKAYHAIRDPRLLKIAYYAAELEVGKAFGGFASTAQLRAGKALKVGYGDIHLVPPPVGNLIWIGTDKLRAVAGEVWALTDAGFEHRSADPLGVSNVGQNEQHVLLSPGSGILLCYARQGSGTFAAEYHPANMTTNAYRSTDGGFTWTPLSIQNIAFMESLSENVVYATRATTSAFNVKELYQSTDAGATWTLMFTLGGTDQHFTALFPSPTTPDTVVVQFESNPGNFYHMSTNGGTTLTPTGISSSGEAGVPTNGSGLIVPDDEFLLYFNGFASNTWMFRAALPSGSGSGVVKNGIAQDTWYKIQGDRIYAWTPSYGGIIVSENSGATWTDYLTSALIPGSTGVRSWVRGFVPKDGTNAAFALMQAGSSTLDPAIARQVNGAAETDPWEDLTTALETYASSIGKSNRYWCYTQGAARLEESSV